MGKRKSLILVKDVPIGQTLKDLRKDEWVTGKSIGSGGFGFIYLGRFAFLLIIILQWIIE